MIIKKLTLTKSCVMVLMLFLVNDSIALAQEAPKSNEKQRAIKDFELGLDNAVNELLKFQIKDKMFKCGVGCKLNATSQQMLCTLRNIGESEQDFAMREMNCNKRALQKRINCQKRECGTNNFAKELDEKGKRAFNALEAGLDNAISLLYKHQIQDKIWQCNVGCTFNIAADRALCGLRNVGESEQDFAMREMRCNRKILQKRINCQRRCER